MSGFSFAPKAGAAKPAPFGGAAALPKKTAGAVGGFGGFSKPASASGGFKAPAAKAPAAGGFKAPAAKAPAAGGFKLPAKAPAGAAANPAFGVPKVGGLAAAKPAALGAPKAGGFGVKPAALGAAKAPGATGFGHNGLVKAPGVAAGLVPAAAGKAPDHARLDGQSLEEIYGEWEKDLSGLQDRFKQYSSQMHVMWLRSLDSQTKIEALHEEVENLENRQESIQAYIDKGKYTQEVMEATLREQDAELDGVLAELAPYATPGGGDVRDRRQKMYEDATNVKGRLNELENKMKDLVQQLNCSVQESDESENMLKTVERILNVHYDNLLIIEKDSEEMDNQLSMYRHVREELAVGGRGFMN